MKMTFIKGYVVFTAIYITLKRSKTIILEVRSSLSRKEGRWLKANI
jgi:hypothetical protein